MTGWGSGAVCEFDGKKECPTTITYPFILLKRYAIMLPETLCKTTTTSRVEVYTYADL